MKDSFRVLNEMVDASVIGSYAIGGAIAASFYIEASETEDIDVFVLYAFDPPLFQELRPIYSYLEGRGFQPKDEHVTIFDWDVQFLLTERDSLREEAIENANIFLFDSIEVRVMLAEYLVADMVSVGRPKDIARAVKFVEEKMADLKILEKLIDRFGLEEKWQRIKQL